MNSRLKILNRMPKLFMKQSKINSKKLWYVLFYLSI